MNWTNYRRLVDYLTDLRETRPGDFNYMDGFTLDRGCVACACRVLMGRVPYETGTGAEPIAQYLNINIQDAKFIWSPVRMPQRGVEAITAALEKLATVAAKYTGEHEPVEIEA